MGKLTRIDVNQIGEYVQKNSCGRRFKLELNNRAIAKELPFYSRFISGLNPVLQEMGAKKEKECLDKLISEGCLQIGEPGLESEQSRIYWKEFLELAQDPGLKGQGMFAKEVQLETDFGRFNVQGRCDFLVVDWRDEKPWIRVIECKASRKERSSHRIQLATYIIMIKALIREFNGSVAGIPLDPDRIDGIVLKLEASGQDDEPILVKKPFDLETEEQDVLRLLGRGGELDRLIDLKIDEIGYQLNQKCDSCTFNTNCVPESARNCAVELLGIDVSTTNLLKGKGVADLRSLAALDPKDDDAKSIRSDPAFVENLENLITRAKARLATLPGGKATDFQVVPFPHISSGNLPSYVQNGQPLVRVFLCIDHDYSEDRLVALSAHVTTSSWHLVTPFRTVDGEWRPTPTVIERSPDKGLGGSHDERPVFAQEVVSFKKTPWTGDYVDDSVAEGELIQNFFRELVDAIRRQAKKDEAPLHFYFWSRGEVTALLEGCSRCGSSLLGTVMEILGCRESLEQLIFTELGEEVRSRYATGWSGEGLVVASSLKWFGTGFHWTRKIEGKAVELNRLFHQDLFDFSANLSVKPDGEWADDADPRSSKHLFEVRPRFYDSLPMPYVYSIWGELPDPESPGIRQHVKSALRKYRKVDSPELLEGYLRARVQAARWIEERMRPKNFQIDKPPISLAKLDRFTLGVDDARRAALDFLRLDNKVGMNDWCAKMILPPIERVVRGECIPVKDATIRTVVDDGETRRVLTGRLDLDSYGENPQDFRYKCVLEEGGWVRGTPCPEGPFESQDIRSVLWDGANFKVTDIDFENGNIEMDFMSTKPDRYKLVSNRPKDGPYYPRMTLDDSPSDFVASRVDERLEAAQNSPTLRWFDPIRPVLPPLEQGDQASLTAISRLMRGFEFDSKRLGEDQVLAIIEGMNTRVQLMQGPPGTGKTTTAAVAALVRTWSMAPGEVLVLAANTHNAIERLMKEVDRMAPFFSKALERSGLPGPKGGFRTCLLTDVRKDRDYHHSVNRLMNEHRSIVGGTTTEVLSWSALTSVVPPYCNKKEGFRFKGLMVDEASMMAMPHFLALASHLSEEGTIMLAGDHRQLSPIVAHDWESEDRPPVVKYKPYVSAYDAVAELVKITDDRRAMCRSSLDLTYRLPPEVMSLISPIYAKDDIILRTKNSATDRKWNRDDPWRMIWQRGGVYLVVHDENGSKKTNHFETELINGIVHGAGYLEEDSVAVMTPHRAQRSLLKSVLSEHEKAIGVIDTVERLQGGERPTIIVSGTQSDPGSIAGSAKFILDLNRTNVIFSRAKERLVVVCSKSLLDSVPADSTQYRSAYLWKRLRDACDHRLAVLEHKGHQVELYVPGPALINEGNMEVTALSEKPMRCDNLAIAEPLVHDIAGAVCEDGPTTDLGGGRRVRAWQELGPGSPPITGVVVDVSNMCRSNGLYGRADASLIVRGYEDLRERFGFETVYMLFGSGLFRDLGKEIFKKIEEYFYEEERKRGMKIMFQASAGVDDDLFTLQWALHDDLLILTNDCYRDHISQNPDWRFDVEMRLVKFMFLNGDLVIARWPNYSA